MFLSRIELNIHRRDTQHALASPQIIHAAVESSFPSIDQNQRNLWRLDQLHGIHYLIILSPQKPDFTHIVEQFGWPASDQEWETKEYATFIERIKQGQTWRFRLCANPTHSEKKQDSRGKVYGHVTAEQQKNWLSNHATKNGFLISSFDIVSRDIKEFWREKKPVTVNTATFEGVLNIVDEGLFRNALINGIGRAKAYGCGLMTLAKQQ